MYSDGPLRSFDDTAVRGMNVLCGPDDGERDGVEQHVSMLGVLFVVQRSVDADTLCIDDLPARCLNVKRLFWVSVSAFAMTGMRLTCVPRRFMTSISNGSSSGMTSSPDEVQARMNPQIRLF